MWRNAALDPSQEADLSQCCINYSYNYIIYTISSMILVKVRDEISYSRNRRTRGMGAQYYCQQPQVLIDRYAVATGRDLSHFQWYQVICCLEAGNSNRGILCLVPGWRIQESQP
jgi:hypothetical protein